MDGYVAQGAYVDRQIGKDSAIVRFVFDCSDGPTECFWVSPYASFGYF